MEIDLDDGGDLAVRYPSDIAVDGARGVAYLLVACETASLHEEKETNPCIAAYDLEAGQVRRLARIPGSNYSGKIKIGAEALYLHYPWTNDLYILDRTTLEVRQERSDVFGIALTPGGRVYLVDEDGLRPMDGSGPPQPVIRKYDNAPVEVTASEEHVYVVGYNALQTFSADLRPLATLELPEGQLRATALDPGRDRLYVGDFDGLYWFDPIENELYKAPAEVPNALKLRLSPDGERLYTMVRTGGWFGGTQIVAIDTATWAVETLYTTHSNDVRALDLAGERLLLTS